VTKKDKVESRRAKRIRKVVLHVVGKFVLVPWIVCFSFELIAAILVVHALRPDLDTDDRLFFLLAFPIWISLMWISLYVLWAFYVRQMIRRKGAQRAVRYLSPEVLSRTESRLDRVSFWALGLSHTIRMVQRETPVRSTR